jgi:hypothetical protein
MVAMVWFHRWAHRPQRRHLGESIDASSAGRSVARAQQCLDEIALFEKE